MKYIFIRLLSTNILETRMHKLGPADALRFGIRHYKGLLTDEDMKTGHIYSHAEINYALNDNFIDVNGGRVKGAVSINRAFDPSNKLRDKTMYSIYGVPCTDKEYEKVKKLLKDYLASPKSVRYGYRDFKPMSKGVFNKNYKLNIVSSNFSEDIADEDPSMDNSDLLNQQEVLVCSGFVLHVLTQCIPRIQDWVIKNRMNIHHISPSDLTKLPGIVPFIVWRNCATGQSDIDKLARKLAVDY